MFLKNAPDKVASQIMILFALIHRNMPALLLVFIAITLKMAGDVAFDSLCYDRPAIQEGQLWRLLSGHFVHLGWSHLGTNLAGLTLLWLLIGKWITAKATSLTIILSAIMIGLGLLIFNPEIIRYAGLSGILHGIWLAGALFGMRAGYWEAYALTILLVLKLIWEQSLGPLPTSVYLSGGSVAVDAHLYGAIAGLLATGLLRCKQ